MDCVLLNDKTKKFKKYGETSTKAKMKMEGKIIHLCRVIQERYIEQDNFFGKVNNIINVGEIPVYRSTLKSRENPRPKIWIFTKITLLSIQSRTSWLHQTETRDTRLILSCTTMFSTPSKSLIVLSLHTTHLRASGATSHTLNLLFLLLKASYTCLLYCSQHYLFYFKTRSKSPTTSA